MQFRWDKGKQLFWEDAVAFPDISNKDIWSFEEETWLFLLQFLITRLIKLAQVPKVTK